MADFIKNPKDKIIHIVMPIGQQDDTLCSRDYVQDCDDVEETFTGVETSSKTCTCVECYSEYKKIKKAFIGIRFSKKCLDEYNG